MKKPARFITKIICGRRLRLRNGLEYIATAPIEAFGSVAGNRVEVTLHILATWPA